MLEISGNDIRDLNDSELRSLIGLLCEAELQASGFPTAGVTWGGHQNAKDGGLDVRVELTSTLHEDSFIPRSITGFQVKKPDMPRASIINEMRPGGELRQVIKEIAQVGGAYIIVSSQGSLADSALRARKKAMVDAFCEDSQTTSVKVDFYDRERVAGWVRNHPSLILWVRDKIGRPFQGWKPYGNWTNSPDSSDLEYVLDEHIRLRNCTTTCIDDRSALEGISEIRSILSRPATSVRLVGLSGVGKTRLLQALFDESIGTEPLNKAQVFYTDISDSPNPDPRNMAERLVALQKSVVLIIDNCPPDLHRRLTSVCSGPNSLVSLITVEYDVRDDQPEETEVFRLEPASSDLIEKVIQARYEHISKTDVRTIAEFSGGNARIAIALANTVKRGDSLANLRDDELFSRLFQQRNALDESLLRAAEVCALVYSFDCEYVEGKDTELVCLASLIRMNPLELYQHVSELKRRDLVQQRGKWRAVLPHAIANRLAKRALENIPLNNIRNAFETNSNERLLKSFSRRLSYLHDCQAAKDIAKSWLSEDGSLNDVSRLNDLGMNLFNNIAPINPDITLSAIERVLDQDLHPTFFTRENPNYIVFTRLLRSLAYDKELFERSALLLCRFVTSERSDENCNSIRSILKSLFHLYLSGTHATAEQRLSIIKQLLKSNEAKQIEVGITLLDSALETWHFSSVYGFDFGARSRNYGFEPKTRQELEHWYKVYIEYTTELALSESPISTEAKSLLATNFRGLWVKAGMFDELDQSMSKVFGKGIWQEGWLAVRSTIRLHGNDMAPRWLQQLYEMDVMFKPNSLIDLARLYALCDNKNGLDLADAIEDQEDYVEAYQIVSKATRALGQEVVADKGVLNSLLPELLTGDSSRLFSFGQGLADGCINPFEMWATFSNTLSTIEESDRRYVLLGGFLNALDASVSDRLLEEAVIDSVLAAGYPILQCYVEITKQAVVRLKRSLDFGTAPIWLYSRLGFGRVHETIGDSDFSELVRMIAIKPDGIDIAVDILVMRIHGQPTEEPLSNLISLLGQELVLLYNFSQKNSRASHNDHCLATIIKKCFLDKMAAKKAKLVCNSIINALRDHKIYSLEDYSNVLEAIAIRQPIPFLDVILGEGDINHRLDWGIFNAGKIPLVAIKENIIIDWCEVNPEDRYFTIASTLTPYQTNTETKLLEWTPLALAIIDKCPDPLAILQQFRYRFRPMSWSGSRAEAMQKRLKLVSDLKSHANAIVSSWALKEENIFEEEIHNEREYERKRENDRNECFE